LPEGTRKTGKSQKIKAGVEETPAYQKEESN